jgi:hypothetical protein
MMLDSLPSNNVLTYFLPSGNLSSLISFLPPLMKHFASKIIGFAASSAFLFTAALNSQLVYNASMFTEQPVKFDTRLTEMHTNQKTGEFYAQAKGVNYTQLSRFFGLVK